MSTATSSRKDNSNRKDHGKRRLSRRSVSPIPARRLDDDPPNDTVASAPKRIRTSLRHLKCCCDVDGLPQEFKCDGCSRWDESRKLKPREQMKTREYQCQRVWSKEEDAVPKRLLGHYKKIIGFIESSLHIRRAALVEPEIETPQPPPTTTTTTNDNDNDASVPTPSPPKERNINMELNEFYSNGKKISFMIPSSHSIEHKGDIL